MCIALISTAHPDYSLIIIDNRDEFLRRPTSAPDWWPEPHSHVLGSRDLARATHGTWMGVTKQGKVAVLTNYQEEKSSQAIGAFSRGLIVNKWLATPPNHDESTHDFVQSMINSPEARQVGGLQFTIVSNRSLNMDQITWVAGETGQTWGLSNTFVDDRTWPKILDGESLMESAIQDHVKAQEDEESLIERLLGVLNTNRLPPLSEEEESSIEATNIGCYISHMRKSILIPRLPRDGSNTPQENETEESAANGTPKLDYLSGPYGTEKQTILLAQRDGRVRYFERTLYDNNLQAIPAGKGDRSFEFHIESSKE
ncbi:hypothetical protein N7468_005329 [Penicillium chermesinum]|uniref:DUF833 domain-containing protein n=1 Tax=Penicillium chermesinum TaxID=63820 RepID=A0A9W9TN97_9EURO|nr:uncharacterized protein N7468_005329 [Penicillium chermesinum]KAJ5232373.1 hypothetical protein N7468_005329 [Penicillium chermesinum]